MKNKKIKSKFFPALAVLIGTTIGAGFLGIPYVISKAGFLPGVFFLAFIALIMLFVKLCLGEVSLRTRGNHQLAGYAEKYLGKTGKILMFFAMFFGIFSALVAYLIAEGQSLSYMIFGNLSYALYFSFLFWVIMACLTFIGLKALKRYDLIGMVFVLFIVAIILIFFAKDVRFGNLSYANFNNIFMPFGIILFSFLAFSAMPEVERVLVGQEKLMKKTIAFGILIPFIVYFLFSLVVVGSLGKNVPEIATLALGRGFAILGVLTMFTAFFTQSIAIRDMFRFDFKLGRFKGWFLALFIPLVLFLLIYFFKFADFVKLLSIAGVVSGGGTGILVLLMNIRAKKLGNRKPEYSIHLGWLIAILISIIFIGGVVCQFLF
jgi:tyrosine-specific transport protein